MKTLALAALSMIGMVSAATAARVEFVGALNVTGVSAACTSAQETSVNQIYQMRYNPPNLGVTDPRTSVSLHEQGGSQNYTLPSGTLVGTTLQPVNGTGIYRQAVSFSASMDIATQAPATLKTSTKSVTITGEIDDFDGVAGCNVLFSAAGVKH
jgi:hypothetical protein